MVNYEIENELLPVLGNGERLLWTGKPKQGIVFRNSDFFLIPFSLLWGGFAIFWETTVLVSGAPFLFVIWGIPFLLVGLYITIGRFFVDAHRRAKTIYGITADRIIIKSGIFSRSVNSLNIRTLSDLTYAEKADNSGTILLATVDFRQTMFQGMSWPGVKHPPSLELVSDVKTVYNTIIDLQRRNL